VQKRQDILLDRLLDGTVSQEVYNETYTALQNLREGRPGQEKDTP